MIGQVLPGSISLSRYQQQQFTFSGIGGNVTWWVEPTWMGSVTSTGLYTAPGMGGTAVVFAQAASGPVYAASIFVSGQVPVSSTSELTPTPLPGSVSVVVSPSSTSLLPSQAAQFFAAVTGTANGRVEWSLSPNLGTITNGFYVAPASFANETQVTIFARSVASPSVGGSATVLLTQPVVQPTSTIPVTLSVFPTSMTVQAGQSANFTAMVGGSMNTSVTWSLSPNVGTVVNGMYTAPSSLTTRETVILTATSVADPSFSASAMVTLQPVAAPATPAISISLSPASASLSAGQSATFTPMVSGTSNTAVTWSFNPQVGTLVNGAYTAPATISSSQTVTITATSAASSSQTATASVTLNPPAASSSTNPPTTQSTTITLPIEVLGANGTTAGATFNIPSGTNISGPLTLYMQIHGLRTETQASVQVNSSAWMPISDSTVTMLGNATAYGGIGGGFHTFQMNMNLPAGVVVTGNNTITFRFNQTDGRVSGFRVLALNIQTAGGSSLIPSSTFVQDDPTTWQPPSSSASDIAAGQSLYQTAALTMPLATGGSRSIQAHCSDCHTLDGRDLKYFNYSNNSIVTRSVFHGLTAAQGNQIASYIRSLNVPNPGLPWNPPYQPGPGLDEQPVANWAAGAGLSAVLDHDADMLPYLMPGGSSANWAPSANLSARETPITMQLPDWNSWLPSIHPKDAWPNTFPSSQLYSNYQYIRANLLPNNAASYKQYSFNIWNWTELDHYGYLGAVQQPASSAAWNNPQYVESLASLESWSMTKLWEINQEFGLEGMPQVAFGPQADSRAWYSYEPFFVSPLFYAPTVGIAGVGNGLKTTYDYQSMIWYQVQLILNASNNAGTKLGPSADFGYVYDTIFHLNLDCGPQGLLQTLWLIKGLQASQNDLGPQAGSAGWGFYTNAPWVMVWNGPAQWIPNLAPADRQNVMQTYLSLWLAQADQYTPQQYYAGSWTTANASTTPEPPGQAGYNDDVAYMLPRFSYYGVSSSLLNQIASWAGSLWPQYNWTGLLNVTCSAATPDVSCPLQ